MKEYVLVASLIAQITTTIRRRKRLIIQNKEKQTF
jgi:hypothetical protein